MIKALIRNGVSWLDDQVITFSICETAREFIKFYDKIKKQSLRTILKEEKVIFSTKIDGRSLPAAIWTVVCRQQPQLQYYPLGEIAERAVKKTIVSLIFQKNFSKLADDSLNSADQKIGQKLGANSKKKLLQSLLKHYFFEICIDYMRRPGVLSREYNFSKTDQIVSLATELNFRETLESKCKTSAKKFLPFLEKALKAKKTATAKQQIIKGFSKVFGVSLSKLKNNQKLEKNLINIIVGTRSASSIRKSCALSKKPKRFLLHTNRSNISVSYDILKNQLGRSPHSLVKDLLDLGVVVYMSDLYLKRNNDLARYMGILMPMRHPDLWNKAKKDVAQTIASLGRDKVHIQFVKRKEQKNPVEFPIKSDKRCICLLSGGLDSLAGAVWALDNGLKPIFVSHYTSPKLSSLQKRLVSKLEKIYDCKLQNFYFYISKSKSKEARYRLSKPTPSIMAQHLRSFLFLCLGSAVALESGISKVCVFENGPLALNPLFSEARVNTHTAHPHFLASFQTMIKNIFQVDLQIKNPFVYMTKGKVANVLTKAKVRKLIKETISCWNWFKIPVIAKNLKVHWNKESHDGDCLPCIIRRTALHRAGLWQYDAQYLTDIFAYCYKNGKEILPLNEEKFLAFIDFLRFCGNAKSLSDVELLHYAPDFSIYEKGIDTEEMIQMYREHAKEVIQCFRKKSNSQLKQILTPFLY